MRLLPVAAANCRAIRCQLPPKTLQVQLVNLEDFEVDSTGAALGAADLVLLMTSTYGPGAPPGSANKFLAWLKQVAAGQTEANVLLGEMLGPPNLPTDPALSWTAK
jgi:sulfite reductase alpha subunit-like flavoprotein